MSFVRIFGAAFEHAARSNRMSVEELRKAPSGAIRRKLHDDITLIVIDLKNQGK